MAGSVASDDVGTVASRDAGPVASQDAGAGIRGVPGPDWVDCPDGLAGVIKLPFVYLPVSIPFDGDAEPAAQLETVGALVRRVLFLATHKYFVVVSARADSPASRFSLDKLHSEPLFGVPEHLPERHLIVNIEDGVAHADIEEYLLQNAALVVGSGDAALIRAMLYNRPILVLEPGWWSGAGGVHEVEGLEALHSLQVDGAGAGARKRLVVEWLTKEEHRGVVAAHPALDRALRAHGLLGKPSVRSAAHSPRSSRARVALNGAGS